MGWKQTGIVDQPPVCSASKIAHYLMSIVNVWWVAQWFLHLWKLNCRYYFFSSWDSELCDVNKYKRNKLLVHICHGPFCAWRCYQSSWPFLFPTFPTSSLVILSLISALSLPVEKHDIGEERPPPHTHTHTHTLLEFLQKTGRFRLVYTRLSRKKRGCWLSDEVPAD